MLRSVKWSLSLSQIVHEFLTFFVRATCPAHLFLHLITVIILRKQYEL
jgi:hypothetical protein